MITFQRNGSQVLEKGRAFIPPRGRIRLYNDNFSKLVLRKGRSGLERDLSLVKGRKVKGFSEGFAVKKKKSLSARQETQDTRDVASISGSG